MNSKSSLLSTVPFSSFSQWDVKQFFFTKILSKYPLEELGKHLIHQTKKVQLSDEPSKEFTILGVSNKIGMFDASIEKGNKIKQKYHIVLPADCASTEKEPQKWILRKGDFLITRTNGSKDLIGKAAIFNSDETYTYASYLIRYRFDTTIVLPEYVNILFMTPLVREQIAVMRRQGGGQYNLNSDEIGAIRLPVPSIPIQKQIIKKFFDAKDEAQIYYDAATKCQIEATVNFEKEIFS